MKVTLHENDFRQSLAILCCFETSIDAMPDRLRDGDLFGQDSTFTTSKPDE
jgi:hypothetical protein